MIRNGVIVVHDVVRGAAHEDVHKIPFGSRLRVKDGEKVAAGSWLMTVRIHDDALWAAVKAGKYTGFSIRGTAIREEVD